jgi:hypothetical protein
LRSGAEQSALWSFENFDALEIRGIHIQIAAGQLQGLVVEVDSDVREASYPTGGLSQAAAHREAPHVDISLTRSGAGDAHVRQISYEVVESRGVQLDESICGQGLDLDRDVLHVLRSTLRRDGDFLNGIGLRIRLRGMRDTRGHNRVAAEDDGDGHR